jgi:hypothetical protein
VCPAGYYGLCGGDREAANEADKCGGEEQRPTGQQMLERRWGAALDSRWTVRIDSEEGEDSVGYRACASSRPPGFEVTWRESDCTMSSPSLGPAQPCSTQPLRLSPGSWLRNRVRLLLCIFGFFASRRRDLLATAKTGPSYMQLSACTEQLPRSHTHASLCCHLHVSTLVSARTLRPVNNVAPLPSILSSCYRRLPPPN